MELRTTSSYRAIKSINSNKQDKRNAINNINVKMMRKSIDDDDNEEVTN